MLKIEPSVKTVDFLHLSNKLPNMCTIFNSLRLTKFKFWSLSLHIWHKVHFNQEIKLCKLFLYIFPLVQWLQFFWNLNFQSHSSTSDFVSSSWKLNNQYYTINHSVQLLGTDFSCEYLYILYNLGDNGTNSSASFLGLKNGEMPWFF